MSIILLILSIICFIVTSYFSCYRFINFLRCEHIKKDSFPPNKMIVLIIYKTTILLGTFGGIYIFIVSLIKTLRMDSEYIIIYCSIVFVMMAIYTGLVILLPIRLLEIQLDDDKNT